MKLRAFEVRWADAIGRALLPRGILGGVVDTIDLGDEFRRECLEPPWYGALLLRASLWLTWFAPPLLMRRLRTFGGLNSADRELLLEKLLDSRVYLVRATAMFLKLSACVLLLGDERVLRRVGAYEYGRAQDHAGAAQAKDAS
ncbi:MAG TPA: hypothetical protein VFH73_25600 [Polyangia bacterium]|jgi:hypothetical protein|nr:hypothetical protein [Polyangia bacterium]